MSGQDDTTSGTKPAPGPGCRLETRPVRSEVWSGSAELTDRLGLGHTVHVYHGQLDLELSVSVNSEST